MRLVLGVVLVAACGRVGFESSPDLADALVDGDPASSLVGWWKLDEGTGTTAGDSSRFGNTGTLSAGLGWATGMQGGALDIDGADDAAIDLGFAAHLQLAGSMTVAAWIRARSFHLGDTTDDAIVSRDDNAHAHRGWTFKASEDCGPQNLIFQIAADDATPVRRCSIAILATDVWYHVAGVYDADTRELHVYIDGLVDDGTLTAPVPAVQHQAASLVHVQIGNQNPRGTDLVGGQAAFDGLIDDVRIYDVALGPAAIADLARP